MLNVIGNAARSSVESTQSVRSLQSIDEAVPGGYPHSPGILPVSPQQSLAQAVYARRDEFTQQHSVRIKVGTWNVAAFAGTENDLGGWFVGGKGVSESLSGLDIADKERRHHGLGHMLHASHKQESADEQEQGKQQPGSTVPKDDVGNTPSGEEIGIYALGLQEIVDINSPKEALRPFSDPGDAMKYKKALEMALPSGYTLVAEQQLIGLLLLIYASPAIVPHLSSVSTTSVGTGLMGYMGNKGACTARLVLGETTRLIFVNCHMSAGTGEKEVARRNWDVEQIVSRTKFDPIVDRMGQCQQTGERIGDEDLAFWFGDLNYRLQGIPPEDVRRLLMLHVQNEYASGSLSGQKIHKEIVQAEKSIASQHGGDRVSHSTQTLNPDISDHLHEALDPHSDPESLQTTIRSLLAHDELHKQQHDRKCFHDGWREAPITFLPTYKYDVGTVGIFDSGEKKRGPSWCDRIIYRTRADRLEYEKVIREEREARRKDHMAQAQGLTKAIDDDETLFDYDPEVDGEDYTSDEDAAEYFKTVVTKDGYQDSIAVECYLSHQRVLSSDHKPLEAVFKLCYDAIVPELKSKVQQEVAREIDKAENEGRPVVTIVVDRGPDQVYNAESDGIDFGRVRYNHPKVRFLTVANTGRVVAEFGFVVRPANVMQAPRTSAEWLSIKVEHPSDIHRKEARGSSKAATSEAEEWSRDVPQAYVLSPGDTCTVSLLLDVHNIDLVRSLNEGASLEDILVLRVKNGRDHFVPVRGIWSSSSHGRTIDKLIRIPEGGVRRLQHQRPSGSGSPVTHISPKEVTASDNRDGANKHAVILWSVPREIFRLTEAIESLVERVVAEWGMVEPKEAPPGQPKPPPWNTFAGWPFVEESWTIEDCELQRMLKVEVNEALDTDTPFDIRLPADLLPLQRVEILAESLLDFLRNLEEGVIPQTLWSQLEENVFKDRARNKYSTPDEKRGAILEILACSPPHSTSFVLITSMLTRISQEVAGPIAEEVSAITAPQSNSITGLDPTLLTSPRVSVRRKTLDQNPAVARRQLVHKNFAAAFADILIRVPGDTQQKTKATNTVLESAKRELIEAFLDGGIV